jgi:hypothetical protein
MMIMITTRELISESLQMIMMITTCDRSEVDRSVCKLWTWCELIFWLMSSKFVINNLQKISDHNIDRIKVVDRSSNFVITKKLIACITTFGWWSHKKFLDECAKILLIMIKSWWHTIIFWSWCTHSIMSSIMKCWSLMSSQTTLDDQSCELHNFSQFRREIRFNLTFWMCAHKVWWWSVSNFVIDAQVDHKLCCNLIMWCTHVHKILCTQLQTLQHWSQKNLCAHAKLEHDQHTSCMIMTCCMDMIHATCHDHAW